MTDFYADHEGHPDILVLGMNPSPGNRKPTRHGTFARVKRWMDTIGYPAWDFHNVVPDKIGEVKVTDVDWKVLYDVVRNRKVIVCLGGFAARAAEMVRKDTVSITCPVIKVDHPSARNRNFNDPAYEPGMLLRFSKEMDEVFGETRELSS